MKARLFARFGPEAGLEVEFGAEATIGRGKDNNVLLSSREVSQYHARIVFDEESAAYWIEDLGSLNGTRLDGEPMSGRQKLGGLHMLSFAAVAEVFFVELESGPAEPSEVEAAQSDAEQAGGKKTRVDAEAPPLPVGLRAAGKPPGSATRIDERPAELPQNLAPGGAPTKAAGPLRRRFVLEVLGAGGGRFELAAGDNLVGRSRRARVSLRNRELSRRHATLRVEGGRVWLRDEGSRNHTFVADEQISEEVEIEPGSDLRFGLLEARLSLVEDLAGEQEEAR